MESRSCDFDCFLSQEQRYLDLILISIIFSLHRQEDHDLLPKSDACSDTVLFQDSLFDSDTDSEYETKECSPRTLPQSSSALSLNPPQSTIGQDCTALKDTFTALVRRLSDCFQLDGNW